jgi:Ca-activated chloride channel homolog
MKRLYWMAAVCPALVAGALGCSSALGGDGDAPAANTSDGSAGSGSTFHPGLGSAGTGKGIGQGLAGSTARGGGGGGSAVGAPNPEQDAAAGGAPSAVEEPIATNPFVIASHDPLSTFAADVDTASYDIFMSSVATGSLPPAATVRLEEFVNYFRYAYEPPAPDAEEPFSISLAAAPALDPTTLLFRVGIRGRMPAVEKRPANLVFLVDTSGSMNAPNKLPLVQYTLTETLSVLDPADKISIVSYAGSTAVRLEPTPVADSATIAAAIQGLVSSGGTNGSSGINLAYAQAEAGFIEGGINHVLLCTDGDFNLGITSNDALVDLITEKRTSGITLTALGYGSNPNDAMMERVSNAGNGTYSVIYNRSQSREYVETRLLSNLDYIAKDMKIQVEFNPAKVYAYRLLGYEDRAIADNDFRNDGVDAGEVGAGHRVTALYQLVLAGGTIPSSSADVTPQDGETYAGATEVGAEDYALVKVRYKQPGASAADAAFEVNQMLSADGIADAWSLLDGDFQWAYAVASFAEILKDSPYATPGALNTIEQIIGQPKHDGMFEREQFRTAFGQAKALLSTP